MKYGFVIDNRKCIGCHACTTACKSEHDVPVGVNRTWVKQVEKGTFPNTRRVFSVMRCNHCTDAPCVEICPVEALFFRQDGIVDFDKDRCIGCKSCMQACPYDALYIDPETHTAAKCNYCAHRIDIGLEPACVNICPEHAIISGDMEDPESEIFSLLNRQQVTVRKSEKGTKPNLFYINGDEASLNPIATEKSDNYFWSSQSTGVGHFAKYAEKMADSSDIVQMALKLNGQGVSKEEASNSKNLKSVDVLMGKARRTYDAPDKGILWGWEVSAYVFTKAIAAGVFLIPFLAWFFQKVTFTPSIEWLTIITAMVALVLTGALLVKDLDQPSRFLYVLLRPQWSSWLVKGGYAITAYGGLLTLIGILTFLGLNGFSTPVMWVTALTAVFTAVYTAFLFAQAKGRDFWQSPTLAIHMLVHSIMAGAAIFLIAGQVMELGSDWIGFSTFALKGAIGLNLVVILAELLTPHPTESAKLTVDMITKGRYSRQFWAGAIMVGNIIPLAVVVFLPTLPALAVAGVLTLIGIYITEHIWVEAPQRLALS